MKRSWGILSLVMAVMLLAAAAAQAAVYKPTRLDDPVPGNCRAADCSLREALKASNASPESDTIRLKAGTYELELPNDGAGLDNGSLDFIDGVEVRGAGMDATTIDANDLDQVVTGWNNLSPDAFELRDLTLTGGEADAGFQNDGGAILIANDDRFSLLRVRAPRTGPPRPVVRSAPSRTRD